MEFYHITERKNIASILTNGLEPRIGYRSKDLENEPVICLTEKQYIPYWKILLGLHSPVILKIMNISDDFSEQVYSSYKEIRTKTKIPANNISLADIKITKEKKVEAMKELCKGRILTFSWLCQCCARYYTDGIQKTLSHAELENFMHSEYSILKRMDFSVLTTEEKRECLKEYGENGEFTFLDTYLNTDKKLYQLSMYEDPYTFKIRHNIEDLITSSFDGCLDLCTGGWIDVI